jgi:hypothetical protein
MRHSVTPEERAALAKVARFCGKGWRGKLRIAWQSGTIGQIVGIGGPIHVLQRLRDQRGFNLSFYKPETS